MLFNIRNVYKMLMNLIWINLFNFLLLSLFLRFFLEEADYTNKMKMSRIYHVQFIVHDASLPCLHRDVLRHVIKLMLKSYSTQTAESYRPTQIPELYHLNTMCQSVFYPIFNNITRIKLRYLYMRLIKYFVMRYSKNCLSHHYSINSWNQT